MSATSSMGSQGTPPQKKRMELPKKKEDLEKIVDEIQKREAEEGHEHEHYHEHYHEPEELEDVISVLEILVDSINANVKALETSVNAQSDEIVRLYRVLAKVVEACGSEGEERERALKEAVNILRP